MAREITFHTICYMASFGKVFFFLDGVIVELSPLISLHSYSAHRLVR